MKINFNMSAIITNDCLAKSENALSTSMEKLSSGYKINHAKDNPSGIAIAKKMHEQIRGLSRASQNASDGVSVLGVAEGIMTEVHDMLQRLNELSIKAANGPMSTGDREIVQREVDGLLEEIDRITESMDYNGNTLFDGTFDLKGYVEEYKTTNGAAVNPAAPPDPSAVKIESYSDEARTGYYVVKIETGTTTTASVITTSTTTSTMDSDVDIEETVIQKATVTMACVKSASIVPKDGTNLLVRGKDVEGEHREVNNQIFTVDYDNHTVTITGDDSFSLTLDVDLDKLVDANGDMYESVELVIDLTGLGAMTIQIGPNEGQTIDVRLPKVSCKNLGIEDLDVTSQDDARISIARVSRAINNLSVIRARLGAYENRLEHTISSLDASEESMTAAYSRIMDTDMAEEMTEYTKNQVLSQAGTSMLAQANDRPSQILQLLQ